VTRVPKETKYLKSAVDPLDAEEIRLYYKLLGKSKTAEAAMLRFHLLLGGPRIEQLTNLLTANVKSDYIILKDGKGRGGPPPRDHQLPLTSRLRAELNQFQNNDPTFALSVTPGKAVSATHISRTAQKIVGSQIDRFLLKRVRSSVETILSKFDVSKEVRGRLQSHGVAGVQSVNYNASDFIEQKRQALLLWEKFLAGDIDLPKAEAEIAELEAA
jgi:hypothetical protein